MTAPICCVTRSALKIGSGEHGVIQTLYRTYKTRDDDKANNEIEWIKFSLLFRPNAQRTCNISVNMHIVTETAMLKNEKRQKYANYLLTQT